MTLYLDTNVCVRLVDGQLQTLTPRARALVNSGSLLISPMVILELEYLYEIGRVNYPSTDALSKLSAEIGVEVCTLPFADIIVRAVRESWTRDPFDRVIVAQAKANGLATLLSNDRDIQKHYTRTAW